MKFSSLLILLVGLFSTTSVYGAGVTAGSSDLISTLQYSDTFTIGSGASTTARQNYSAQDFPLPSGVDAVENDYGNPARFWGSGPFSIATDASHYTASTLNPYPGGSGAGSATGFTQTGLGGTDANVHTDFGIAYGLSNNFVVQVDAVQPVDRFDINIGSSIGIGNGDGLSVFFRQGGVGIFNDGREIQTGFTSPTLDNTWNNYAVDFNLTTNSLSIYTNEVLLGTVDLNTFGSGAFADVLDSGSNEFVSIGASEPNPDTAPGTPQSNGQIGILWTDNFEVGTVPEPGTWALLLGGVIMLAGFVRVRHMRA